jgi:hypothetical protein
MLKPFSTLPMALGLLPVNFIKGIVCLTLLAVLATACSPEEGVQSPAKSTTSIAKLNVQEAAPGDRVAITGAGFESADVQVHFGNAVAKIVSVSDSQLVVEVPESAVSGEVTITVNGIEEILEELFNIIINRVRPTYWAETDEVGNTLIVRGTADLLGNTTKTVLYTTPNIIPGLSLETLTNQIFWVEQELNLETFEFKSTIYKSNANAITTSSKQVVVANRVLVTSLSVSATDNKLFWTETVGSSGALFQATYAGGSISQLYSSSLLSNVASLKYEDTNNVLYAIQNSRQVVRALADGSAIAAVYSTSNPRRFRGVAFDVATDRLFVASLGLPGDETDYIFYGNLAGTVALDTLVSPVAGGSQPNPVENTSSLDVDRIGNFLYWLNAGSIGQGDGSIYRLKLSGAAIPQLIFDDINIATSVDVRGRSKEAGIAPGLSL